MPGDGVGVTMAKMSKKYRAALEQYDSMAQFKLDEAINIAKKIAFSKMDETLDLAINLGVNPKYPDQMVRGAVALPHGIGKTVRVLVFAKGDKVQEARDAGADFVGGEDLIERIKEGWLDFDKVVATPDVMGLVGRIGKILGPRGLMPNPKVGTVTFDVASAVRETKAGRVEFRTEKAGIVHAPVGKISFAPEKLRDNVMSLIDTVLRLKPSTSKGTYLKSVYISSTFGPGVRIDTSDLVRSVK